MVNHVGEIVELVLQRMIPKMNLSAYHDAFGGDSCTYQYIIFRYYLTNVLGG